MKTLDRLEHNFFTQHPFIFWHEPHNNDDASNHHRSYCPVSDRPFDVREKKGRGKAKGRKKIFVVKPGIVKLVPWMSAGRGKPVRVWWGRRREEGKGRWSSHSVRWECERGEGCWRRGEKQCSVRGQRCAIENCRNEYMVENDMWRRGRRCEGGRGEGVREGVGRAWASGLIHFRAGLPLSPSPQHDLSRGGNEWVMTPSATPSAAREERGETDEGREDNEREEKEREGRNEGKHQIKNKSKGKGQTRGEERKRNRKRKKWKEG